jgi:hypothetical protein
MRALETAEHDPAPILDEYRSNHLKWTALFEAAAFPIRFKSSVQHHTERGLPTHNYIILIEMSLSQL